MALSGSMTMNGSNEKVKLKMNWSAVKNYSQNSFTITCTVYAGRTDGYETYGTAYSTITIAGSSSTVKKYVTLNSSSGWVGIGSFTKTISANSAGELSPALKYTFNIPGTSCSGTTSKSETVTLTPIGHYAVKYSANGGSGAPSAQTKVEAVTLKLSSIKPSRTGYTFSKWNTNSSGTGTSYISGANYTANAALGLYAVWAASNYTVTLDPNNGELPSSSNSITVTYNKSYGTLPNPTRVGYSFSGWYLDLNGQNLVTSSTTMTIAGNHTLYAKWIANEVSVSFNTHGGSCETTSMIVTYDSTYGNLPIPTKEHFSFNGWFDSETGGTKHTSETIISSTSNYALHAQWTQIEYLTTYYAYDSTNTYYSTWNSIYEKYILPQINPNKTGYSFSGWYTQVSGGIEVTSSTNFNSENLNLYARFTPNTYTVTLDPNVEKNENASVENNQITVTYDAVYGNQLSNPTDPTEQDFEGWLNATTNKIVGQQTVVSVASDHTLIAQWDIIKQTITYVLGDGLQSIVDPTAIKGTEIGTLPTPTKPNNRLLGFYFEETFDTLLTEDHIVTSDITVYAKWERTEGFIVGGNDGSKNAYAYVWNNATQKYKRYIPYVVKNGHLVAIDGTQII